MPVGLALGKATVNGASAVTVVFLCRVPDKRHSVKKALPINFLPCVLCRVPHSAKALSSAALGKGFAKYNLVFAECLRHSTKNLNPVVHPDL